MLRFFLRRLMIALLAVVTVSIIGFSLLRASGDLASQLAAADATVEDIARITQLYGLDRPLYEQYLDWAGDAMRGDLGRSLFTDEPVTQLILDHIGVTVLLAALALSIAISLAIPLGTLAAVYSNTWIDRFALGIAVFGQAVPNFWLGLILAYVFGVYFAVLPISGQATPAHFVLPSCVLAFSVLPALMRLTRTGMLETLQADYIRTARAKGLGRLSIIMKHALRNAILPVVSVSAVSLGFLIGGSVVIESIFGINGIGWMAFNSIMLMDFPVVQSILVVVSVAYIALTFVADLLNAKLDPRIRL